MENLSSFTDFAQTLVDLAAQETLPLFRQAPAIENKHESGFDPVTQADRSAEQVMRAAIEEAYPEHSILGEEFGEKKAGDWQWVLDPIDGTRAFITGLPSWGTLIGLNKGGTPYIGVFDQPFTKERLIGVHGEATRFRQKNQRQKVTTRKCSAIEDAMLATTDHRFFVKASGEKAMAQVLNTAKMMRYGGDCYNYAMLACGHLDGVIEQGLQAYDIQAFIPIIEGAGGIITNWQGGSAAQGGQVIACGSGALHAQLLELFAPAAI